MTYSLFNFPAELRGPFNLGALGYGCRVLTIAFCLFTMVVYSFPFYLPVSGSGESNPSCECHLAGALLHGLLEAVAKLIRGFLAMNYISVVIFVVLLWGAIDWSVRARKTYIGCHNSADINSRR